MHFFRGFPTGLSLSFGLPLISAQIYIFFQFQIRQFSLSNSHIYDVNSVPVSATDLMYEKESDIFYYLDRADNSVHALHREKGWRKKLFTSSEQVTILSLLPKLG